MPETYFVVVGDGSMIKQLKKLSAQLGMGENVRFVDWLYDTTDVYTELDIVVHTSRNDGTSLVVLEAMASGRPVAGLAVGGVREVIENDNTGILVEGEDWQELGTRIANLLEQPERLKCMGHAGRKRVEEHFNVSMNTTKTANLLRHLALAGNKEMYDDDNHNFFYNTNGNGSTIKS